MVLRLVRLLSIKTEGTVIGGLDVSKRYSVVKIDSNKFNLIDVGIGGTITTDLVRTKTVDFQLLE